MKLTIETFGNKVKVSNSFGEVAYLSQIPKSGQVVKFSSPRCGPVDRMIESNQFPQGVCQIALEHGSILSVA